MVEEILVLGHARHGKDTAAEYLSNKLGLAYSGSSEICAALLRPRLIRYGLHYNTVEECFEDRVNHRALWRKQIAELCADNKCAVSDAVYKDCSIYCGIRTTSEAEATIEKWKPIVIWVDASGRLPLESADSMQLTYQEEWLYIDNNGSFRNLEMQLDNIIKVLGHE